MGASNSLRRSKVKALVIEILLASALATSIRYGAFFTSGAIVPALARCFRRASSSSPRQSISPGAAWGGRFAHWNCWLGLAGFGARRGRHHGLRQCRRPEQDGPNRRDRQRFYRLKHPFLIRLYLKGPPSLPGVGRNKGKGMFADTML